MSATIVVIAASAPEATCAVLPVETDQRLAASQVRKAFSIATDGSCSEDWGAEGSSASYASRARRWNEPEIQGSPNSSYRKKGALVVNAT